MNIIDAITDLGYHLLDKGFVPDVIVRVCIRALCRKRLYEIENGSFEANHAAKMKWIDAIRARTTIADVPEKANEQHYEVSTKFIISCLGPYAKYSSCLYPTGKETLADAEILMMESYCEKAKLSDGMDILDLGCGWGSLSVYIAQKYPKSRITALSNSTRQKAYIEWTATLNGLTNLEVITADVNNFDFAGKKQFDRILSIEMFEHMKNYQALLHKISTWLRPRTAETADDSLLFVQIFCHKTTPYHFEQEDGWMAQNFFSGGTMPSHDLLLYFQSDLQLIQSWYLSGQHYSRTLEHWLQNQDKNTDKGRRELKFDSGDKGLGQEVGEKAFYRFRVFFMACSELFAMNNGQEWGVGHYLFKARHNSKAE